MLYCIDDFNKYYQWSLSMPAAVLFLTKSGSIIGYPWGVYPYPGVLKYSHNVTYNQTRPPKYGNLVCQLKLNVICHFQNDTHLSFYILWVKCKSSTDISVFMFNTQWICLFMPILFVVFCLNVFFSVLLIPFTPGKQLEFFTFLFSFPLFLCAHVCTLFIYVCLCLVTYVSVRFC